MPEVDSTLLNRVASQLKAPPSYAEEGVQGSILTISAAMYGTKSEGETTPASFDVGVVTVLAERFELQRGDELKLLTAKELGLLQMLYARRGTAVSRGEILQEVWNLHPQTRTRVVDTFVLRLRKLIEPDPANPKHLLAVRAYGYRLEP